MKFLKSLSKNLTKLWQTKRWWVVGGLAVLLIIVWQVSARSGNQEQLNFVSPTREDLVKTLEVSGVVDAKEKATLRFLAGGKIVYLGAKEGDPVKKWQTIAQIDAASAAKAKEKELNDYLKERLDWEQQLDDVEDRPIDQEERRTVDKNQLDLENTVLDVEIASITVANTIMSSPIQGILVSSPTNVANVQLAATDTFLVVNPETLIVRALVDEADIAEIKIGQSASIELDAYPDQPINSTVRYIAYQSTTSSSGTVFEVELPINEAGDLQKYRLGMNGDINIKLEEKQAVFTVPLVATRERDGKTYVDVRVSGNEIEEREIKIGLETEDKVEVLSGLAESDEIVMPE
jgi:RND family efflux transporter MFP subunit